MQTLTVVVTLTHAERDVLLGFIDAGLKVAGLSAAQNAIHLATKIQNARPAPLPEVVVNSPETRPPSQ
jgi:hypothetical protein